MSPVTVWQAQFLDALVEYLVGNEAEQSIKLSLDDKSSLLWLQVRSATPLTGYYPGPTGKARARQELKAFLGWPDEEHC